MSIKVTLRKKDITKGRKSLYLDFYPPIPDPETGKLTRREFLGLYLEANTKSKLVREQNKRTMELAEGIRSKRLLDLQHDEAGFGHLMGGNLKKNFVEYFEQQAGKRYESNGNYANWDSVHKHIIVYAGTSVTFKQVDQEWVEGFKDYLKNQARTKSGKHLSQNSCYSYFNKLKACLKQAVKDKLILHNPAEDVSGFKQADTEREYLTLEELSTLAKTECESPMLKNAFMFSALTGMRWSDVVKLEWKDLQHTETQGWFVRFRQKKTKGFETLPINEQAKALLGEKGEPENRVFTGLKYSAWNNLKLQQWVTKAGISKKITFHCA